MPYFFSLTFLDQEKYIFDTLNLSMVASVVSNLNGLMVSCLHMFFRSQTSNTIGYNRRDLDQDRSKHDQRGSSDDYHKRTHAMQQITDTSNDGRATPGSSATLQHATDTDEGTMGRFSIIPSPLRPNKRPTVTVPDIPTVPAAAQPPSATSQSESRKQSYSLFPSSLPTATATLPATTYTSVPTKENRDSYRPPPIVKPWLGRGHRRESSIESSATVQIGIRLSNVTDFRPPKTSMDTPRLETVLRPSPLAQGENTPTSESVAIGRVSNRDARMKNLPPVPTNCVEDSETTAACAGGIDGNERNSKKRQSIQPATLDPSVYAPDDNTVRRTASKRSDNRNARVPSLAGGRLSLVASRGDGDRGSVHAPPRPRGSTVATQEPMTRSDWI